MDENTLATRLRRYAQSSTSLAGFLTKLASAKVLNHSPAPYAESLKIILGNLKGPILKIGQILSMVPDLLPEEYAAELQTLQSDAPPMGELFVRRRMRGELGIAWEKNFQHFELRPFAAASLGQIHQAIDLQGNTVACKLQYPDMAAAVQADLTQLKGLLQLYKTYGGTIDTTDLFQEISTHLQAELDYGQEARNIHIFQQIFQDCSFVRIPHVITSLSTEKLLVMSFLKGHKIQEFYDSPAEVRHDIAQKLFYGWYYPFYKEGVLHGDPHFGNYSIAEDGALNMLDFGCVRFFDKKFIEGVVLLYRAFLENNSRKVLEAYELWGFEEKRAEVIEVLNLWARYLYGPLLEDKIRPIDINGLAGKEVAKLVLKRLKELGGVKPPQEFVFMDRTAVGLGSAFIRLKAELNWHQLFEEILAKGVTSP